MTVAPARRKNGRELSDSLVNRLKRVNSRVAFGTSSVFELVGAKQRPAGLMPTGRCGNPVFFEQSGRVATANQSQPAQDQQAQRGRLGYGRHGDNCRWIVRVKNGFDFKGAGVQEIALGIMAEIG